MSRAKTTAEPPKGSPEWRAKKLANAAADRETRKSSSARSRAVLYVELRACRQAYRHLLPYRPPTAREHLVKSAEVLTGTVTGDTIATAEALAAYYSAPVTTESSAADPTPPPSVACLTGIPITGHDYGATTRVVREVTIGGEREETAPLRFQVFCMRQKRNKKYLDGDARCLRCVVLGMHCSLEWPANGGAARCNRCVRNGCAYCVRVLPEGLEKAPDDPGNERGKPGYGYLTVPGMPGAKDLVIYIRDTRAPDPDVLRDVAMELLQEKGTDVCGVLMSTDEQKAFVLPSWQRQVVKWRELEEARDVAWAKECERTGLDHLLPVRKEGDEQAFKQPTWEEYFERRQQESGLTPDRARQWTMWNTWGILG